MLAFVFIAFGFNRGWKKSTPSKLISLLCPHLKSYSAHIKQLALFISLVIMGVCSYAQNQSFNQNHIITKRLLSVEDGLPSRTVKAAAQDKAGFMWFATANGLCRYDGTHFKTFNTKNSKLLSNAVVSIAIDAENHLFVISNATENNKGIFINVQVLDLNGNYSVI